jgi:hypothetical protein
MGEWVQARKVRMLELVLFDRVHVCICGQVMVVHVCGGSWKCALPSRQPQHRALQTSWMSVLYRGHNTRIHTRPPTAAPRAIMQTHVPLCTLLFPKLLSSCPSPHATAD